MTVVVVVGTDGSNFVGDRESSKRRQSARRRFRRPPVALLHDRRPDRVLGHRLVEAVCRRAHQLLGAGALLRLARGVRQQLLLDSQHLLRPVRRGDPVVVGPPLRARHPLLPVGADDPSRAGAAVLLADGRLALRLLTLRTRCRKPGPMRTHVFQLRSSAQPRNDAQLHDETDEPV